MNPKLLEEQATLLAWSSKTQQRATTFIAGCQIIHEQADIIKRLVQHIANITNEIKQPPTATAAPIQAQAPKQP